MPKRPNLSNSPGRPVISDYSSNAKSRGFRPPRSEDDAINPKTRRPYWDENAPDAKAPGWKNPKLSRGVGSATRAQSLSAQYAAQRKAAGTKGY